MLKLFNIQFLVLFCLSVFCRFKHHSMAYHGPTATLIKVGKEELLVVAVDVEWR